jgi:twitching motility protein PilT
MTSEHEKILVVDDDKAVRELLREKLTKEGYLCQEASNADEALERIKVNPPALAILDVKISGKRGAKLWREIRAIYPDNLAVLATGDDDVSIAAECMKQGVNDYLPKPLNPEEVMWRVRRALMKRRPELGKTGPQQLEVVTEELKLPAIKIPTSGSIPIDGLLKLMVDTGASDLHLKSSVPPVLRIDGMLIPQEKLPPLSTEEIEGIFVSITTPEQRNAFAKEMELDFAYTVPELARFRVSALRQKGTISLALRLVPFRVFSIDEMGLPQILKLLALKPRGLILVTGTTGSGKSTTLAAMINHLNENERRHVITIEDPIEFVHEGRKGIMVQRDLGDDTKSFATALVHALRHDPDVIVVGEMRDLETIATAITAAEMGRLVLSTLHTVNAAQTIDRVIDVFPPAQQQQIRFQLSQVLEAVLSQILLRRIGGGRVAAFEILIATPAVRNLIRNGKTFQLPSVMELGSNDGMQTLNQALADLIRRRVITREEAMMKSNDPEQLRKLLQSN